MSPIEPLVIREVRDLQRWADETRAQGRRIALVPTMGALHEGHLWLVRVAHAHADRVVVSIFVHRATSPGISRSCVASPWTWASLRA